MFIFSLDYEVWSVLLFLFFFMRFVCVAQMFIFSLDYEMWSALLFLFCLICFVFDTQMFIFSLDYEMLPKEQTIIYKTLHRKLD
jgi:hypothetical protein